VTSPGRAADRPVRAVLFDWGGTITPWHEVDFHATWGAYAAALGHTGEAHTAFVAAICAAEDAAWKRGRCGGGSARLGDLLEAVGVTAEQPGAAGALAAYRELWEPHTLTAPGIKPLWEALRGRGIRVGVVSNTIWDRDYHRWIFERDGVLDLVDVDVYSSETPWVKPQREIFAHAARAAGLEPTECAYVGDRSYEDVHGPQQVGMRAIWVPHSTIPLDQQVSHDATPDAVAHELMDVLAIVDRWNGHGGDPGPGSESGPGPDA
jgi:putative hydrolase of the HAD superfamily